MRLEDLKRGRKENFFWDSCCEDTSADRRVILDRSLVYVEGDVKMQKFENREGQVQSALNITQSESLPFALEAAKLTLASGRINILDRRTTDEAGTSAEGEQ